METGTHLNLRISGYLTDILTDQNEDRDEDRLHKLASFQKLMLRHAMTCEPNRFIPRIWGNKVSPQCHKNRVFDMQRACP